MNRLYTQEAVQAWLTAKLAEYLSIDPAGPIEGAKVTRAAQEAGFKRTENIHGVRIEGSDKPGLGAKIARAVAESGVSVRGLNAMAMGKNFLSFLSCDSADDAAKALKAVRKL